MQKTKLPTTQSKQQKHNTIYKYSAPLRNESINTQLNKANMNTNYSPTALRTRLKNSTILRTALIDSVLLATACLIPTLSHITALPLYQLNPMLLVLLAGMLFVPSRANTMLLALLLPTVSMLAVGMPTPLKAVCMVAEMLTIVSLFSLLQRRWATSTPKLFASLLAAMLCGKITYYALKALLIAPAALISTPLALQATVTLGAALLFCAAHSLLHRNK